VHFFGVVPVLAIYLKRDLVVKVLVGSESVVLDKIFYNFSIKLDEFKESISFFETFFLDGEIKTFNIAVHVGRPRIGKDMAYLPIDACSIKVFKKFTAVIAMDHANAELCWEEEFENGEELLGVF
jgi:hypothetical protein